MYDPPRVSGRLVAITIVILAALSAAFLFAPGRVILILSSVLMGISVAVGVYYLPSSIADFRAGRFDRVAQLTLGIVLGWFGMALSRGWASVIRLTGDHDLSNAPVVVIYLTIGIFAGALHITAPGATTTIPRKNWINLALAVALGLLAAIGLVYIDILTVAVPAPRV